jgi:hypothetical protein
MFIPEIITPTQYYAARQSSSKSVSIKRLMMAMLADAVRCYQGAETAPTEVRRQLFREARRWLFEESSAGPFSFEMVCEMLVIKPQFLRRRLKRWRALDRAGLADWRPVRRPLVRYSGQMRPPRERLG